MSQNLKYPYLHVEKIDSEDCEGITDGTCYVFAKLDGTNGSVWFDDSDNRIHCGSRTRELSIDNDNAGFMGWVMSDDPDACILRKAVSENPDLVFYGEWLASTKFSKNYLQKKKFYVFDAAIQKFYNERCHGGYVTYDVYSEILNDAGYPYIITPLAVIDNPTREELDELAQNNHFILPDTVAGEGVVVKNYNFKSKYGNYEVGKIVLDSFKQQRREKTIVSGEIESEFAETVVTAHLVQKCLDKAKLATGCEHLENKLIGTTMTLLWKDCIEEELYAFLKKHKNPTVDFKNMQALVNAKCRKYLGL